MDHFKNIQFDDAVLLIAVAISLITTTIVLTII